jgi:hypothetical protein
MSTMFNPLSGIGWCPVAIEQSPDLKGSGIRRRVRTDMVIEWPWPRRLGPTDRLGISRPPAFEERPGRKQAADAVAKGRRMPPLCVDYPRRHPPQLSANGEMLDRGPDGSIGGRRCA